MDEREQLWVTHDTAADEDPLRGQDAGHGDEPEGEVVRLERPDVSSGVVVGIVAVARRS